MRLPVRHQPAHRSFVIMKVATGHVQVSLPASESWMVYFGNPVFLIFSWTFQKIFSFKKHFTKSSNDQWRHWMSLWKSAKSTASPSLQRWNKTPKVSSTPFFSNHFLIQRNTRENVKPQACSSSKIHRIKDHSGRPFPRWLSGVVLGLLIHGMILYVYGAKGKQWRTEGSLHWSVRTYC